MVFIDNLVDALIACANRSNGSRATYFVSDGSDLSVAELIGRLRAGLRMSPRLWMMPEAVVVAGMRLLGRADAVQRLFSPLRVNIDRIRNELGWSPPVLVQEGLHATMDWFLQARAAGEA
jgi:UDP-glucose 4-epimerase